MVINRKNEKKPIWMGIVIAVIINVMFYAIEWSLWKYTDLCNGVTWHYYDFAIRMSMGFLGIWALRYLTGGELKTVFCGKITPRAWLWCIPLGVSLLLSVSELLCAGKLTVARTMAFFIAWLTQIGSGFYEEIVDRGVLMNGLIAKYKNSVKGRLFIVVITGSIFGMLHLMNFIFGNDFWDCVLWGLSTMMWGMLISAIYMLTSNLWLVIGIHTIWDIVCKIPTYFIADIKNDTLFNTIRFTEDYVMNGIFFVCAVAICVWGFKDKEVVHRE